MALEVMNKSSNKILSKYEKTTSYSRYTGMWAKMPSEDPAMEAKK